MNSRFGDFKKSWWNFGFELGIEGQEGTGIQELSNMNMLSMWPFAVILKYADLFLTFFIAEIMFKTMYAYMYVLTKK